MKVTHGQNCSICLSSKYVGYSWMEYLGYRLTNYHFIYFTNIYIAIRWWFLGTKLKFNWKFKSYILKCQIWMCYQITTIIFADQGCCYQPETWGNSWDSCPLWLNVAGVSDLRGRPLEWPKSHFPNHHVGPCHGHVDGQTQVIFYESDEHLI